MKGKALKHMLATLLGFEKPHSQTTPEEIEVIKKYSTGKSLAVEIGVYEGVNTITIAESISGILYGIDPFFKGSLGLSYHMLIAKRAIKRQKLSHKIHLINKLSFDATSDVPDNIDFIFIDGDHSYDGIKKDWENWWPKVKNDGYMLLHDTTIPLHNPSVESLGSYKFFQEFIKNQPGVNVVETVDSLNVLKKNL